MNSPNGKLVIYLASLSHSSLRSQVDDTPLAIGDIAAYLDSKFPRELDIYLFRYSEDLDKALKIKKPNIVGFSNYYWTENISKAWAKAIKRIDPNILILMGGPNFPIDECRQLEFLQSCPSVDLYVRLEGESATKLIVDEYKRVDGCLKKIKEAQLPSCTLLSADGSRLVSHPLHPRIKNLDDIPSPFLNHFMDGFFNGQLIPAYQTNRGCPFLCTYCNSGDTYYNKMSHFSVERVTQDLEYIAKKISETCPHIGVLRLVDDNFGMYKRDQEIVQAIIRIQKRYGYPKKIIVSTGKNQPERILDSVKKLGGSMGFTAAVQTMDEDVLKAIKRENISREAYFDVAEQLGKSGLIGIADTILGLPEESKESYFNGLKELIDAGIQTINTTTAFMMMGSELETDATRNKYNIGTHWRLSPGAYSEVGNKSVMEIEEIITSSSSMPFEDWMECRNLQIWFRIFCFGGHFEPLHKYLTFRKINFLDVILKMRKILDEAPQAVQNIIYGYEKDAKEELFETPDGVRKYYSNTETQEKILSGQKGNALALIYASTAKIEYFSLFAHFVQQPIIDIYKSKNTSGSEDFEIELNSILAYLRGQKVIWDGINNLERKATVMLNHDVEKWKMEGYTEPLKHYKYPLETETLFDMETESWEYLINVRDKFSCSTFGILKLYRLLDSRHYNRSSLSYAIETEYQR
jgi:radical SAM superfamily enzyme YgiQ (UPF0313 family)